MERINNVLKELEERHLITILYAAEVGSRVWGYSSHSSDYDVRFIYKQPLPNYLSVLEANDVISESFSPNIECQGWDLFKAGKLFLKSNPSLFEWLFSPEIYTETTPNIMKLRNEMIQSYSLKKLCYHYLNLVKNNSKKKQYSVKDMIHMLRGIMMTISIMDNHMLPPLNMYTLCEQTIKGKELQHCITSLLTRNEKKEWDHVVCFILNEIKRLEKAVSNIPNGNITVQNINRIIWDELALPNT